MFDDCDMSPGSARRRASPAAVAFANRFALDFGRAVAEERQRRGWTARGLAERSRLATSTVVGVEAGRPTSVDIYGRLAVVLGIRIEVTSGPVRRAGRDRTDIVRSAMGEFGVDR